MGTPEGCPKILTVKFLSPAMGEILKKGDMVLLVEGKGTHLVHLDGNMSKLKGKRGAVNTSRIIGMEPGQRLDLGSRSFTIFKPDIRDLLDGIERGAQIIIPKDASGIVHGLGLSSGSKVVEGGAGSGGLTLFLLNSVSPGGMVHTYDIREDHLGLASTNVIRAGLEECWDGKIGDVREGVVETEMDAFVVDVPEPEKCIRTALKALRPGGRFCAYVPTTNQMERVVLSLRDEGFISIEPLEIIQRGFSVKEGATRPVNEILSHTGFLIFARWPGSP